MSLGFCRCVRCCPCLAKLGQTKESLPLLKTFNMVQAFLTATVSCLVV